MVEIGQTFALTLIGVIVADTPGWFTWCNRLVTIAMMVLSLVMLVKWGRATLRLSRNSDSRRDRRLWRASLAANVILLLTLIVGGLLLGFDPPVRVSGSCWILIGLTGFIPAIRTIGEHDPTDLQRARSNWPVQPTLEIVTSGLMTVMGVVSLV